MRFDLRLPNITAQDPQGKMTQMQSYMYQLVEQLNFALTTVDAETERIVKEVQASGSATDEQQKAIDTFSSIKELIIKSADIIEAYEEQMSATFNGLYVAQSDYGTYTQETKQTLEKNSKNITSLFSRVETIEGELTSISKTKAYVRTGVLDETGAVPIIGVEVGQETEVDGLTVFNKFARFTAGGVYFYNAGQTDPVAWMTGQKLFITNAQITSSLTLGKYELDVSNGIIYRWVG